MEWRRKQEGDVKFRKRFILVPECYGKNTVWLESIYEKVVWERDYGTTYWRGLSGFLVKSVTKEKLAMMLTSDNEHTRELGEFIWKKEGFK